VWKTGHDLAEARRYYEASDYWLSVLDDEEQRDGAARRGLKHYGEHAAEQLLGDAHDHAADDEHQASLDRLDQLDSFIERLESHQARVFPWQIDTEVERADVLDDLADYRYTLGTDAQERKHWADAAKYFEGAREVRPDFRDTTERLTAAYTAQALAAKDAHRYADAIAHYRTAYDYSNDPELAAWAAAIRAALGRYYLKQGACREASRLFSLAEPHAINDPKLSQDLSTARDCAEVELVVELFEMGEGTEVEGTDLGRLVSDKLAEQLGHQGTDHVRLIDSTAHVGQTVMSVKGHRYVVRGRISRLQLDRPPPVDQSLTVDGTVRDLCPGIDGYYTTREEYCDEVIPVRYNQHEERVEIKVSASLRLVSPMTGEQALTRTLDSMAERQTVQVSDFQRRKREEWVEIGVGTEPSKEVATIPQEILDLRARPEPLPSDGDLLSLGADTLATEAAAAILEVVDREEAVLPPKLLANIRAPLMDAGDIDLTPGEVRSQPTPIKVAPPVVVPIEQPPDQRGNEAREADKTEASK
jgi:tetratricopeptide (TPR) repeat protein